METTRREYRRLVIERGKEGKWRERNRGKGEGGEKGTEGREKGEREGREEEGGEKT